MGHARRITRAALVLTALTAILAPCARADAARHDGSRPSGAELGDVATRGASTRGASTRGDVDALDAATCAARVNAAIDPPPREANQSPRRPLGDGPPRRHGVSRRPIHRPIRRDYRMVGAHAQSLERVLGPPRNAADLDANLYAHDDPPADALRGCPRVGSGSSAATRRRSTPPISPSSRLGGADDATSRAPSPSDSAPGASLTETGNSTASRRASPPRRACATFAASKS